MTTFLAAAIAPVPPTGASAAFTSRDPLIRSAVDQYERGLFDDAAQAIAHLSGREADELRDLIARTRRDFNLTEAQLIEKLKPALGEVSVDDIARWRKSGQLQHRVIDGKTCYFRREPANLFRFCPEAIERRDARVKASEETTATQAWVLEDHLAKVVAAAEKTGEAYVQPVHHRIRYSITVPANPEFAKPGSRLRVWLPFIQEDGKQHREVKLLSMSPEEGMIAPNASFNADGTIAGAAQRTVYFEKTLEDLSKSNTFAIEFEYLAYAYYPQLDDAKAKPLPADFPRVFLDERQTHIKFTPALREKVNKIVGDEANPLIKARKIWRFVDSQIRYNSEVEYCTIASFSDRALKRGRGDCGVQAMLFITMCRAAGIPARWQSGWETKKVNWSMHDWAEFYVEPWGWLPADVSYGTRTQGAAATDAKVREFYFGHQDAYRWIVNYDFGSELQPPIRGFRAEPADFQKGEVEIDGKVLYYDAWDYDVTFEWLPLDQ